MLILFPTQHLLIDLAPEYSFCHRIFFIRCEDSYKIPITKEKNKKMPKFSEDYYRNTPKFSK